MTATTKRTRHAGQGWESDGLILWSSGLARRGDRDADENWLRYINAAPEAVLTMTTKRLAKIAGSPRWTAPNDLRFSDELVSPVGLRIGRRTWWFNGELIAQAIARLKLNPADKIGIGLVPAQMSAEDHKMHPKIGKASAMTLQANGRRAVIMCLARQDWSGKILNPLPAAL